MAINPLAYTEKVIRGFLRYQLTTDGKRFQVQGFTVQRLSDTRVHVVVAAPRAREWF